MGGNGESLWPVACLSEKVDLLTGYPFKSSKYTADNRGVPLLRGDNIAQGKLRWDGVKRWPIEEVKSHEGFLLKAGDIVLAMDRPWIDAGLKYACVSHHDLPCLLVQRVARIRGQVDLHSGFLRYLIGSREFTDHVLAVQTGTAVPHISSNQIRQFRFRCPPIRTQRAIAHILGTLDDKIELNRRMNETLEAMARAIFKSWFVDFDPVRAKMEGRQPSGMDADTAQLFPDSFQDSALGKIPKGWEVGTLESQFEAIKGLSYKGSGLADNGMPLHNLNSVYEGGGYKFHGIKYYKGEFKDRHEIRPGDVIVTNTEQGFDYLLIGYPAIVPKCFGESGLFSHHIFRMRKLPTGIYATKFAYLFLRYDPRLRDLVTGCTNGTTVNMLNIDGLQRPLILVSPPAIANRMDTLISPLLETNERLHIESQSLASLRDTLLPKLLSGELRVPDAEKMIEEVA